MLTKIEQKKIDHPSGFALKEFSIAQETLKIESRKISGIAATFGNIDSDKDRLHKGCFERSITERGPESNAKSKIVLLWQHKRDEPIGKITSLKELDEGLYFEAELDEGVPTADRAIKQLESGTINNFSIGFQYEWETMKYDEVDDVFDVFEVKLFEISPVSIPADKLTYYMGLKNDDDLQKAELELSENINTTIKKLDINLQREVAELFLRQKSLSLALSATQAKQQIKQCAVETPQKEVTKSIFADIKIYNK